MVSSVACVHRSTLDASSALRQLSAPAVPLVTARLAIALPVRMDFSSTEPFAAPASRSVPTASPALLRGLAQRAPQGTMAPLANSAIVITISPQAAHSPARRALWSGRNARLAALPRARSAI